MFFSLIIPVYNRPDEIDELLESLTKQTYSKPFEVVIIEDGSAIPCGGILSKYSGALDISYHVKQNSGPGDSRNYGMNNAKGDYFVILDSDCILPEMYLQNVSDALHESYTDCFGGPDAALPTFTPVQKAINFAMTSFLTTGGFGANQKALKSSSHAALIWAFQNKLFKPRVVLETFIRERIRTFQSGSGNLASRQG